MRVFEAVALTVGSEGDAQGNIDGNYSGTSDRAFRIPTGESSSEQAVYSVPKGRTANFQLILGNVSQSDEDNNSVLIRVRVRERADLGNRPFVTEFRTYLTGGPLQLNIPGYGLIQEKSDIEVDGRREGQTEAVALSFQLVVRKEPES